MLLLGGYAAGLVFAQSRLPVAAATLEHGDVAQPEGAKPGVGLSLVSAIGRADQRLAAGETVTYDIILGGSATAGVDYRLVCGQRDGTTIAGVTCSDLNGSSPSISVASRGDQTRYDYAFHVVVVSDGVGESTETITIAYQAGGQRSPGPVRRIEITDAPTSATVQFGSATSTAPENHRLQPVVEVLVNGSEAAFGRDITLKLKYADGTAHAVTDYQGAGTITIPAGAASASFDVLINADDRNIVEGDETFSITLDPSSALPEGVSLGNRTSTAITITDATLPRPVAAPARYHNVSVSEGSKLNLAIAFDADINTHRPHHYLAAHEVVTYKIILGGTATAGSDYRLVCEPSDNRDTLTGGSGDNYDQVSCGDLSGANPTITVRGHAQSVLRYFSGLFRVEVLKDNVNESDETITIAYQEAGQVKGPSQTLTITARSATTATVQFPRSASSIAESRTESVSFRPVITVESGGSRVATTQAITLKLTYTSTSSTATAGADFTTPATMTIPVGQDAGSIPIKILNDDLNVYEGDETFTVAIDPTSSLPPGITLGSSTSTTVTITDAALPRPTADVSLLTTGYPQPEGAKPTVGLSLNIGDRPHGYLTEDEVVTYNIILGGTATRGTDYRLRCGLRDGSTMPEVTCNDFNGPNPSITVTSLGEDESAAYYESFHLEFLEDNTVEADETVTIAFQEAGQAEGLTRTITIADAPDTATVQFPSRSFVIREGIRLYTLLVETLVDGSRAPFGKDITLKVKYTDGTASAETDYTGSATITIPAGIRTLAIPVDIALDGVYERDETFTVSIDPTSVLPTGVTLGSRTSQEITIEDADSAPSVKWAKGSFGGVEGGFAMPELVLSGPAGEEITVTVTTYNGGSATAQGNGVDYQDGPYTVTFPPGVTRQSPAIPLTADAIDDESETFDVRIGAATPSWLTTPSGNQRAARVWIAQYGIGFDRDHYGAAEGAEAIITMTLSAPAKAAARIQVTETSGTATGRYNTDYHHGPYTVDIAKGDTSTSFAVPTYEDLPEGPEDFSLAIDEDSLPSWLKAGLRNTAQVVIWEGTEGISVSRASPAEVDEGGVAEFTINAGLPLRYPLDVTVVATDDHRRGYLAEPRMTHTVTIPANAATTTLALALLDNDRDDPRPHGTVTVAVYENGLYTAIAPTSAKVSVVDNDPTWVEFFFNVKPFGPGRRNGYDPAHLVEGGSWPVQLAMERTLAAGEVLTIPVDLGGTATSTVDYTLTCVDPAEYTSRWTAMLRCTDSADRAAPRLTITGRGTSTTNTNRGIQFRDVLTLSTVRGDADRAAETLTIYPDVDGDSGPSLDGGAVPGGVNESDLGGDLANIVEAPTTAQVGFLTANFGATEGEFAELAVRATPPFGANIPIHLIATPGTAQPGVHFPPNLPLSPHPAGWRFSSGREMLPIDDDLDNQPRTFTLDIDASRLPDGVSLSANGTTNVTIYDDDPTPVTLSGGPSGDQYEATSHNFTLTVARPLVGEEQITAPLTFGGTATPGADFTLACPDPMPAGIVCNDINTTGASVTFSATSSAAQSVTITLSTLEDNTTESGGETVTVGLVFVNGGSTPISRNGGAKGVGSLSFNIVDVEPITVPWDWDLLPEGLTPGDKFHLMFVTRGKKDGVDRDIAPYNALIQQEVAAGHAAIQPYSSTFRALASIQGDAGGNEKYPDTGWVDARDNLNMWNGSGWRDGSTNSSKAGIPTYWVNGVRVAAGYADLWDDQYEWDHYVTGWNDNDFPANNVSPRRADGTHTHSEPFWELIMNTGTTADGQAHTQNALGVPPPEFLDVFPDVTIGRIFYTGMRRGQGPIQYIENGAEDVTTPRHYYGVSPVFVVGPAPGLNVALESATTAGATSDTVNEGQSVTIRARLTDDAGLATTHDADLTLPLRYEGVSEATDYQGPASVTIPAGQSGATFTVRTFHDIDDRDEQVRVRLLAGSSGAARYVGGLNSQYILNITDLRAPPPDSPTVTVTASTSTVDEGDDVVFQINLDRSPRLPLTIYYSLVVSKNAGADYGMTGFEGDPDRNIVEGIKQGKLIFQPGGALTFSVTESSVDDPEWEADGWIMLVVNTSTGVHQGDPYKLIVTLQSDDEPPPGN